jgi:hypothetical protein
MARPKTNDIIIHEYRQAMRQRAETCAKFIATRRRKLTVDELAKVIFTAWQGAPLKPVH